MRVLALLMFFMFQMILFPFCFCKNVTSLLNLVFFMFILSNALLLYSVYQILKNGIIPKDKFDDGYWYANVDKQYSIESPRDTE